MAVSQTCAPLAPVGELLKTALTDLLPALLYQRGGADSARPRRLSANELNDVLNSIALADPMGLTLLHLQDLAAASIANRGSASRSSPSSNPSPQKGLAPQNSAGGPSKIAKETKAWPSPPLFGRALPADEKTKVTQTMATSTEIAKRPNTRESVDCWRSDEEMARASIACPGGANPEQPTMRTQRTVLASLTGTTAPSDTSAEQGEASGLADESKAPSDTSAPGLTTDDTSAEREKATSLAGTESGTDASALPQKHRIATKGRRESAFRTVKRSVHRYSVGEITALLRAAVGNRVASSVELIERFDEDMDGVLSGPEFSNAIRSILNQEFDDENLRDLYDLMTNAHDECLFSDIVNFCSSAAVGKKKKFSRPVSQVITSIALSLDQTTIAVSGEDSTVQVYDLDSEKVVMSQSFSNVISCLCLSSSGKHFGVACVGGVVKWMAVPSAISVFEWDHPDDIHGLAIDAADTLLLAAGGVDNAVTLYSLENGKAIHKFASESSILSVALAQRTTYILLLEDGREVRTSRMKNARFEGEGAFMSQFQEDIRARAIDLLVDGTETEATRLEHLVEGAEMEAYKATFSMAILEGVILRNSKENVVNVWAALHQVLNSTLVLMIVIFAVLMSILVTLLSQWAHVIDDADAKAFETIVSLAFIIEFALRLRSYAFVEERVFVFFRSPLNATDFCVIMVDSALLIADAVVSEDSPDSWAAFVRGVRVVRLVRFLRIFRLADVVNRKAANECTEFDVLLNDGTMLRNVLEQEIISLDAKLQVKLHIKRLSKHGEEDTDEDIEERKTWSAGLMSKQSTFMNSFTSRQRAGTNNKAQYTDQTLLSTVKRFQQLEEGAPVEVCIKARLHCALSDKLVALGGESRQAVVWQFDMSDDQLQRLPQQRRFSRRKSRNGVTAPAPHASNRRIRHSQLFTDTVNR